MQKRQQGRLEIEQRTEEEYQRWTSAGQEDVDELWKELAFEMESEVLYTCVIGWEEHGLHWKRRATEEERRRGDRKIVSRQIKEAFGEERKTSHWNPSACCKH